MPEETPCHVKTLCMAVDASAFSDKRQSLQEQLLNTALLQAYILLASACLHHKSKFKTNLMRLSYEKKYLIFASG